MTIKYSIKEIMEMAEEIERNGAKFYKKAASLIKAPKTSKLLSDLAAMELDHEKTFSQMEQQILKQHPEEIPYDPDSQAQAYINAIADGNVFDIAADPSELLTPSESPQDILSLALDLEKNSIVFYTGIKQLVTKDMQKKVDDIIAQEMTHISFLSDELNGLN